jgi:hypothetical protein
MKMACGPKRSKGFRDKYLAPAMIVAASLFTLSCSAQFNTTDSLHRYNNRYIRNSAVEAFSNLRLNTLLHGIISWIDSARAGTGGSLGIDTVFALNDSVVRYKKNGVNRDLIVKGVYDSRRKVDSLYMINDSVMRMQINGANRDVIVRGAGGTLSSVPIDLDSIRVLKYSGYSLAFPIDVLGDNDWVTKQMLVDALANVGSTASYGPTLTWPGFPEPVDVDTLDWIGTRYQDSLHTSRIDSLVDNWPTGGGSAFGDTVAHDPSLTGQGIVSNVLKADTNVITAYVKQRIDSILAHSVGIPSIVTAGTGAAVSGTGTAPDPYVVSLAASAGNPSEELSIMNYGGVRNNTSTSSKNANLAAWNAMMIAAKSGQICVIPPESFYFPASALSFPTNKIIVAKIIGNVFFPAGTGSGFVMEGTYHYLWLTGSLNGGNSGATDSAGYADYLGSGIYLKNCDKCTVKSDGVIEAFKYGIKYGGESSTTAKGTQYGRIWFNQIRNNYADIYITTTGTTTDGSSGNWATSGYFGGGQLGRHTLGQPGVQAGVYGVLVEKGSTSNQGNGTDSNPFNYFLFDNLGYEGMMVGNKAQKLWYSTWRGGRNETNAVDSALFDLQVSTTGGLGTKDNDLSDFPGLYETSFKGIGNGTRLPPLLDSAGVRSAFYPMPNGFGGIINFVGSEPTVDRSINDVLAADHFPASGYSPETHAWHFKRRRLGLDDYVSFDGKYKTVTTSTYTVETQYSTIYGNGTGAQTFTLPAAASFPKKIIDIKNKSGTYTITVNGVAANNTASLAPYMGCLYESDGASWYAKVQVPTTTGGGGSGDLWDSIGVGKISYNGLVAIGFTGTASAVLELSAGNTTRPALIVGEGQLTTVPKNNAFENYQTRQYFTSGSTRREFVMAPAAGGAAKQYLRWPTSGTALQYVSPNYEMLWANNAGVTVANTTTSTSILSGNGTLTPITDNAKFVFKASGYVSTNSGSQTIQFALTPGGGSGITFTVPVTLPGSLSLQQWTMDFEVTATGTAYTYRQTFTLINAGVPTITQSSSWASSGWSASGTNINSKVAWSAANASNSLLIYNASWEIFRQQ